VRPQEGDIICAFDLVSQRLDVQSIACGVGFVLAIYAYGFKRRLDYQQCKVKAGEQARSDNPFGPRLSPMS
jgi:hypothetical protein